ncbi:MAG: hypothetical protein ABW170_10100 [Candidatus Thiodiazotropha sp. L084R]
MSDIRVILGKVPCLLNEIISKAILRESNISIVGKANSEHELFKLCVNTQADLIILGSTDAGFEEIGNSLLQQFPKVKIVVLTESGRSSFVYELRPHKVEIGELSAEELVGLVMHLFKQKGERTVQ